MSNSREATLDLIKDACTNITMANGFNNDVQDVLRKFVLPSPDMNLPILMVLGGSEVYDEDMGDDTNVDMRAFIRGYSQDHSDPEVALNHLIADVLKLIDHPSYKPVGLQIQPIRTDTDEGWLNVDFEGMGLFDMELHVIYRFDRSDP